MLYQSLILLYFRTNNMEHMICYLVFYYKNLKSNFLCKCLKHTHACIYISNLCFLDSGDIPSQIYEFLDSVFQFILCLFYLSKTQRETSKFLTKIEVLSKFVIGFNLFYNHKLCYLLYKYLKLIFSHFIVYLNSVFFNM